MSGDDVTPALAHGFYPAGGIVLTVVILAIALPQRMSEWLVTANSTVVGTVGWLVLITSGFVIFCGWLAFSRCGDITLGRDDEKPECGMLSWFAVPFSAGIGLGAGPGHHMALEHQPWPGWFLVGVRADRRANTLPVRRDCGSNRLVPPEHPEYVLRHAA